MIYRISVDGERKYAEASIRKYSIEADNLAREEIIRHYLEEVNAVEVIIDTTIDEARVIHEIADEFYGQLLEFHKVWKNLPDDKSWDVNEMCLLIPQLMGIYMTAMILPEMEYMEDADYETSSLFQDRKASFSDAFDSYWTVFNPYCCSDLYEKPLESDDGICKSMLSDDFSDIITDLERGIGAYKNGLVCEAIFQWRYSLISHYGQHIWNALSAMCSAWEKAMRDKNKDLSEYWAIEES